MDVAPPGTVAGEGITQDELRLAAVEVTRRNAELEQERARLDEA